MSAQYQENATKDTFRSEQGTSSAAHGASAQSGGRAPCALGRVGLGVFGSGVVGSVEVGSGVVGSVEVESGGVGSVEVGSGGVGSVEGGSVEVGSGGVGSGRTAQQALGTRLLRLGRLGTHSVLPMLRSPRTPIKRPCARARQSPLLWS